MNSAFLNLEQTCLAAYFKKILALLLDISEKELSHAFFGSFYEEAKHVFIISHIKLFLLRQTKLEIKFCNYLKKYRAMNLNDIINIITVYELTSNQLYFELSCKNKDPLRSYKCFSVKYS